MVVQKPDPRVLGSITDALNECPTEEADVQCLVRTGGFWGALFILFGFTLNVWKQGYRASKGTITSNFVTNLLALLGP